MFDIGFSELLLVFVIGLVVLGPQRLPIAVKTVVGWIRAMRSLAANVQNELAQELKLQELQDSLEKVEQASKYSLSPKLKESVEELRKTADAMRRSCLGEHDQVDDETHRVHHPLNQPQDEHMGVTPGSADHQVSTPAQKLVTEADDAAAAQAAANTYQATLSLQKSQAELNDPATVQAAWERQQSGKPINNSVASDESVAVLDAKIKASPVTPASKVVFSAMVPATGESPVSPSQPTMNDEHGR